jgi:hypothetical protein
LIFCLSVGCGRWTERSEPAQSSPLTERRDEYRALVGAVQDMAGFIEADHCDSTLFSGLLGAAGVPVRLTAAEDPEQPGRWYRRPTAYPECWALGASRSTISRDQLLGVIWWAWRTRDLATLERLWDYGSKRDWFMGDDNTGGFHTVMNTSMVRLLAEAIAQLGGANHAAARVLPMGAQPDRTDFEAHLQVLQLALLSELQGGLAADHAEILLHYADARPGNALFQAVAARAGVVDPARAENTLLDPQIWPPGRLPTSADRCEPWVVQRDPGADWAPCDAGRTHSGGDLLFTISILEWQR